MYIRVLCSLCGKDDYTAVRRTNTKGEKVLDVCHRCNGAVLKTINRHNKRARNKGLPATLTSAQWIEILQKSEGYCIYCKEYEGKDQLTPDHVIPISRGGANSAENIVAACFECNSSKMASTAEEFIAWIHSNHIDHFDNTGLDVIKSIWAEV